MPRLFRILDIDYAMKEEMNWEILVRYELDPGIKFENKNGTVALQMKETQLTTIALGDIGIARHKQIADKRFVYFVTQKLLDLLSSPDPSLYYSIELTQDDVTALNKINPNDVDFGNWVEVP